MAFGPTKTGGKKFRAIRTHTPGTGFAAKPNAVRSKVTNIDRTIDGSKGR